MVAPGLPEPTIERVVRHKCRAARERRAAWPGSAHGVRSRGRSEFRRQSRRAPHDLIVDPRGQWARPFRRRHTAESGRRPRHDRAAPQRVHTNVKPSDETLDVEAYLPRLGPAEATPVALRGGAPRQRDPEPELLVDRVEWPGQPGRRGRTQPLGAGASEVWSNTAPRVLGLARRTIALSTKFMRSLHASVVVGGTRIGQGQPRRRRLLAPRASQRRSISESFGQRGTGRGSSPRRRLTSPRTRRLRSTRSRRTTTTSRLSDSFSEPPEARTAKHLASVRPPLLPLPTRPGSWNHW